MVAEAPAAPAIKAVRKRKARPGDGFGYINVGVPQAQIDHMRYIAATTGKSMAAQVTEAIAAMTGIGTEYTEDN